MEDRIPLGGRPAKARLSRHGFALLLLLPWLAGCAGYHGRGIQYQIQPQYAVTDAQFLRSMNNLVGPGLTECNHIQGLINGDQIFPSMLAAVRGAQKSITLETYIYWSGSVGKEFAEALAERSRAGVKVHVLMDWIGSRRIDSADLDILREAGVEVVRYNPLVWYNLARINHRDHRKLLVVDGRIGFIGGAGLADIWLGNANSPEHWRDSMFRVEGPVVAQMQAAFMDNWLKSTSRVLDGSDYFPALAAAGQDMAQVFISSPREGIESVRLMYLLSIAAARKSIRLSVPYFIPGELTTEGLVDAAKRGVKVEIVLPGSKTDTPLVRYASRARWGPLLAAGIKIYEYQPTMYHCKIMIVDDVWVSVGSANFDNRSFRLNDEANMNIYSADFAAEQAAVFELDKKQSEEVSYTEWKKRGAGKRLMEKITGPFRSQL